MVNSNDKFYCDDCEEYHHVCAYDYHCNNHNQHNKCPECGKDKFTTQYESEMGFYKKCETCNCKFQD
jgi:hypothetical protein